MNKRFVIAFTISIIAIFVLIFGIVIIKNNSKEEVSYTSQADINQETETTEKWQEGVITYKEQEYKFDNRLKTYLFMGIDKNDEVAMGVDYHDGGQSDAMFLLVINEDEKDIAIVSIPRNTMTMVDEYTEAGEYYQQRQMQICLAHAYGDGGRQSCLRAVDAVERLFYKLPIDGYFAINMGAVPIINDTVDGVTVTALEDVETENTHIKAGDVITLADQQAYDYVHYRIMDFGGANLRLLRQNQYILEYLNKLIETADAKGKAYLLEEYQKMDPYVVTNIDFADFVSQVSEYKFDTNAIITVPGELKEGEYDEYYVDEDEFYDMIINIWYQRLDA